ncbi:MAG: Slp family lipoprotein [Deltaproteobacteria bacterium]|nr:Slp family lipoprotein [Deltaproteobacteria bacterium]
MPSGVTRCGLLFVLLLIAACSSVSREYRQEAEPRVDFEALKSEPDRYIGRTVILGGYIIETEITATHSYIHVLQTPLDISDLPGDRDQSRGRFIVRSDRYLDPEIYAKDRLVTAAGSVLGSRQVEVGTRTLVVPLISGEQIVLHPDYTRLRERYYEGPFIPYYFDLYPFYYPPYRF